MKEKLMSTLGVFGVILYYITRIIVSVLPFVMIGLGFWGTLVLIFINSAISFTSIIFWIWGLIAAIGGKQDFWAILYYICFAIIYIPFLWDLISSFFTSSHLCIPKHEGNYKKNSKRLLDICGDLIEKYQAHSLKPSCKTDLLELINTRVVASKEEIAEWKDYDTDYIKIAHTMLAHASFDLLASGRYHLYAGLLNPMSCADNLMDVYKASMEYGIMINLLDEDTRKEQYEYLLKRISEVG